MTAQRMHLRKARVYTFKKYIKIVCSSTEFKKVATKIQMKMKNINEMLD